jgi:hypothetical protein
MMNAGSVRQCSRYDYSSLATEKDNLLSQSAGQNAIRSIRFVGRFSGHEFQIVDEINA